jgi:hypothetical protein
MASVVMANAGTVQPLGTVAIVGRAIAMDGIGGTAGHASISPARIAMTASSAALLAFSFCLIW